MERTGTLNERKRTFERHKRNVFSTYYSSFLNYIVNIQALCMQTVVAAKKPAETETCFLFFPIAEIVACITHTDTLYCLFQFSKRQNASTLFIRETLKTGKRKPNNQRSQPQCRKKWRMESNKLKLCTKLKCECQREEGKCNNNCY